MTLRLDRILPICLILDLMWQLLALDDVSITTVNHTEPMIEFHQYRLQCHISNEIQAKTVKWYKRQSLIYQETHDISKTPELTIVPNRTDDGAQYRCEAELNGRMASSKNISIQVFYVSITTVNHTGPMIEFHQYRLQCHISNEIQAKTVKWYKRQSLIYQETHDISKTPELTIVPNRTDDGAQYRCEAELNGRMASSKNISIQVFYVSITTVNHTGPMIEFHQYRLQCHISNEIQAKTVKWYKRQSLIYQETHDISKTPELTIVPNRTDDGAQYRCEAELNGRMASSKNISIQVFYVSITTVNHTGPMIEFHQYRLQCHISNEIQAKTVKWYKRQSLIYQETHDISKTPELTIVPNRTDDGAQYRCEAELNGRMASSKNISIQVFFKPTINGTNLPTKVPVFRGYPLVLVCEAEGNPKPTVSWNQTSSAVNGGNLTITELISQNPVCNANNSVGSTSRNITVVPTEDYLPLIAGLVAITVAIISVIFVFIYSIYYKTAKMGHYSLKDAKPSPQNGNIAQNGKDNPLHMKKLSQSDILAYP